MTTETVEAKAGRLNDTGAVSIDVETDELVVATVTGDTGTWRVTRTRDGAFAGCSCPSIADCSHIAAVALKMGPPEASETAETVGEPPEGTEPGSDLTPSSDEAESEDLGEVVDPETGEIVEAGRYQVNGGLAAVANKPIDWGAVQAIARTEFVPASLRGKPASVLAAIYFGAEWGLAPMTSLSAIAIVDGRPAPSAELLSRAIRSHGHRLEVLEATDTGCRLKGTRADDGGELEVAFTIDDAVRAGLVSIEDGNPRARSRQGKPLPWELYTGDLLFARAVSRLWRRLFSDVTTVASANQTTGGQDT